MSNSMKARHSVFRCLTANAMANFEQFSETVAKAGLYWMLVNKPPVHDGGNAN